MTTEAQKPMTYGELKDYLQTLTAEQLEQPVRVSGEEMGGIILEPWELEEDYICPTDEGMEPRSVYASDPDYADEPTSHAKGTVLLVFYHQ